MNCFESFGIPKDFIKGTFIRVIQKIILKVLERSPEENFFQEVFLWRSPIPPFP
jgi:hypothetical protein